MRVRGGARGASFPYSLYLSRVWGRVRKACTPCTPRTPDLGGKMTRRCLAAGCPVLVDAPARRCAGHERELQRRRNKARPWYGGDWPARARRQVASVPWCQCLACDAHGPGPCGSRERLAADHVVPRDPMSPLATLCAVCNGSKGGRRP